MIITTNLPPRLENSSPTWKKLNPGIKTADGREHVDPTPMAPPINFVKQPHLWEQMRAMVRSEALRYAAEQAGAETFEEAEDFDCPDDDDRQPDSQWEDEFEGSTLAELKSLHAFAAKKIKEQAIREEPLNPRNPAPAGAVAPTSDPDGAPRNDDRTTAADESIPPLNQT